MRDIKVRVIYPPTVTKEEVAAACMAAGSFSRYGILHDSVLVSEAAAIKDVRNGEFIRSMLTSPNPTINEDDMHGSKAIFPKHVFPLGIMNQRLHQSVWKVQEELGLKPQGFSLLSFRTLVKVGGYVNVPATGIARKNEGALVSLARMRELEMELRMKTIEMAVKHELGHVFGKQSHCKNEGCIMQENADFQDFVERFVKQAADFCKECSSKIAIFTNMILDL